MPTDQERRAQGALRARRFRARRRAQIDAGEYIPAPLSLEDEDRRRRDNRERQRRYRARKSAEDLEMLGRMGHLEICTLSRCTFGCHIAEHGPPPGGYDDAELTRWAIEHGYYDELHAR